MNGMKLVVAAISKEIYLTKILKSGMMSDSKRNFTTEAVRSVMEWFLLNKHKVINMKKHDGEKVWMFCTEDKDKAERILAIIEGVTE